jgi:hypothetical protein
MSSSIDGNPRFACDLGRDIWDHVPFHASLRALLVTYSEPNRPESYTPDRKFFETRR